MKSGINKKMDGKIGIASPAGVVNKDDFFKGVEILEEIGFEVLIPDSIFNKHGYLAGKDRYRVEQLHDLFLNNEVSVIMCARGGYGSMRILPFIDFGLLSGNQKKFIGFSDISVLLNAFNEKSGIHSAHGPVVSSLIYNSEKTIESLKRFLIHDFYGLKYKKEFSSENVIFEGKAEGKLIGGNLASLCHLTGTPFEPEYSGSILFLEDTNEPLYKLDRMLTQMKLAGNFNNLKGVIVGSFINCGDIEAVISILKSIFIDFNIPLISIPFFGHGAENLIIPVGVHAELDTEKCFLAY